MTGLNPWVGDTRNQVTVVESAPNQVEVAVVGVKPGYAAVVPSGSTTATVTHSLNTTDVVVQVYEVSSGNTATCSVARPTANTVTLTFVTAPTANQYRVLVLAAV